MRLASTEAGEGLGCRSCIICFVHSPSEKVKAKRNTRTKQFPRIVKIWGNRLKYFKSDNETNSL